MQISAPADKRFRRAHVKPARRRRTRAAVWLALRVLAAGVALAFVAHRGATLVLSSSVLHVDRVIVRGNDRLSTGEVLALVDGLRGRNILTLDLRRWQDQLIASPWVGRAALRRVLPSTIEIDVVERRPIALARLDRGLYLVDDEGVIIDEYGPQYAEFDLPVVDGLAAGRDGAAPAIDAARIALAARVLGELAAHPELGQRVSQIDVQDERDAVVLLDGDAALIHLGTERFIERIRSYLELAPALRERVPRIDYVDLRFDERVYVRPAQGSERRAARTARSSGTQ